ncbi:hypothetical protein L1987_72035 [Smallanthus sonchifolius]|uniref:Uncharacterized protein n=1 Tax=Smallanthus sonchifolius TaxID=185202 RepID=A0ACB9AUG4_9ASTR|nr:hypothetical protein L1987_72035 [Smallanthus sonchifolius]
MHIVKERVYNAVKLIAKELTLLFSFLSFWYIHSLATLTNHSGNQPAISYHFHYSYTLRLQPGSLTPFSSLIILL